VVVAGNRLVHVRQRCAHSVLDDPLDGQGQGEDQAQSRQA
jgi:hypothetical protein